VIDGSFVGGQETLGSRCPYLPRILAGLMRKNQGRLTCSTVVALMSINCVGNHKGELKDSLMRRRGAEIDFAYTKMISQ
jgi:hypothetical protein